MPARPSSPQEIQRLTDKVTTFAAAAAQSDEVAEAARQQCSEALLARATLVTEVTEARASLEARVEELSSAAAVQKVLEAEVVATKLSLAGAVQDNALLTERCVLVRAAQGVDAFDARRCAMLQCCRSRAACALWAPLLSAVVVVVVVVAASRRLLPTSLPQGNSLPAEGAHPRAGSRQRRASCQWEAASSGRWVLSSVPSLVTARACVLLRRCCQCGRHVTLRVASCQGMCMEDAAGHAVRWCDAWWRVHAATAASARAEAATATRRCETLEGQLKAMLQAHAEEVERGAVEPLAAIARTSTTQRRVSVLEAMLAAYDAEKRMLVSEVQVRTLYVSHGRCVGS